MCKASASSLLRRRATTSLRRFDMRPSATSVIIAPKAQMRQGLIPRIIVAHAGRFRPQGLQHLARLEALRVGLE